MENHILKIIGLFMLFPTHQEEALHESPPRLKSINTVSFESLKGLSSEVRSWMEKGDMDYYIQLFQRHSRSGPLDFNRWTIDIEISDNPKTRSISIGLPCYGRGHRFVTFMQKGYTIPIDKEFDENTSNKKETEWGEFSNNYVYIIIPEENIPVSNNLKNFSGDVFIFNETGFIEGKRLKEGLHIASLTLKSKHNPIHHDTNGKEYQDTYHYDAKEHKWALLGDIITKEPQQSKLPPYVYKAPIPPLLSDKEISKGIAKAVADILQNEPTKLLKKESCNQINQWKKLIQFKPGWILGAVVTR